MTRSDTGADGAGDIAGGLVRHVPVLLNEVITALSPASGETILDGTFGAGGYSKALLEAGANVIALDRDPAAIAGGAPLLEAYPDRLMLVEGEFANLDAIAAERLAGTPPLLDGVVLDIGVSSMQLDQAERGFSFQHDGPLDMRMAGAGISAADVVNHADAAMLTRILGIYGEERQASRVARAIVAARQRQAITTTAALADLIEKTLGRRPTDRIHPATRSFQGLRIFVNQELEQLAEALFAAERALKPGGRLAVVTFHSLEDRIVKRYFAARRGVSSTSRHLPEIKDEPAIFTQEKRSAITPGDAEIADNPRARSAKLRWGIRSDAPAGKAELTLFKLPKIDLSKVRPDA